MPQHEDHTDSSPGSTPDTQNTSRTLRNVPPTDGATAEGASADATTANDIWMIRDLDLPPTLTHSERLIRYVDELDIELFTTPTTGPFASFPVGGGRDTTPIRRSTFSKWLKYLFYQDVGKPPSAQAFSDAMSILEARALFEGETREVHIRVVGSDDRIHVDLCNEKREIVTITPEWHGVQSGNDINPSVSFYRPQGTAPLPTPLLYGSLELLQKHICLDEKNLALLCGFLVQCLRPTGPYPILVLRGEQGSGKSTAARMIRSLIDPSLVPLRTAPQNERDLVIAATNGWMLTYDNLDRISESMSNAFCRLSTGGGFETRRLYSGREQEIFSAQRPLLLNGITDLMARPDLRDRALVIELSPIPPSERRSERAVWADFENDRGELFGALCDAVQTALRRIDDVELDDPPRMADFAEWAVAAEPSFPVPRGTFMTAYRTNRNQGTEAAAAADTVAAAISEMLDKNGSWTGTTSDLLKDLPPFLPDPSDPPKDFPRSYQALGAHLRRIAPLLRATGIKRIDDGRARSRAFTFTRENASSAQTEGQQGLRRVQP